MKFTRLLCDLSWFLVIGVSAGLGLDTIGQAQEKASSPSSQASLTIDGIFGEKQFSTKPFAGRWQKDSSGFERIRFDPVSGNTSIVRTKLSTPQQEEVVVPSDWLKPKGSETPLKIEAFEWSADQNKVLLFTNTERVWRFNTRGDYWVLDRTNQRLIQVGKEFPKSSLMFAKFSPDAKGVAFVQDRDIYLQSLEGEGDSKAKRLTHSDAPTKIFGTFDWVYEEEFGLRDGFRFSADGKRIAFWEIDASGIESFPLVNNTDSLYPKIQFIPYPKVGTTNPAARIGVLDLSNDAIQWMDVPGDRRNNYLPRIDWVTNTSLSVQQLNRLQNRLQFFLADVRSGATKAVFTETDAAWIDVADELFWLKDRSRVVWLSERSGWRHIYIVSSENGSSQAVTSGEFDVMEVVGVDEEDQRIYFYASPDNASQKYLYRVHFDGSRMERVTPASLVGTNLYMLSPDAKHALVTTSSFQSPPHMEVVQLRDHLTKFVVDTNDSLKSKLAAAKLPKHEFFQVRLENGVSMDGWAIHPPDFQPSKKYPLLIFVYGEPAGQTVLDQWGGDRTLWHHMMAQKGYVVMSIDNRGTPAPKGREWRKSIYRQIGILASQDQADAVKAILAKRPYLDAKRVGVWGWSGGGSMTLNALFRYPDIYATGVSIAPVPNQLYYDTIYQERYMGLPSDNSDGYRKGSPITFAHQLKGDLLLVHGTGDDNCHYQTTELLINELIKNNKQFSMFAYPNRTHAIREGENTTRHLFQMMTNHFLRTLPP